MADLATYSFTRADANPLPNPPWVGVTGFVALKVLTNKAVASIASNDCWGVHGNGGVTWPADQYSAIILGAVGGSDCGPVIHVDAANTHGYMCTGFSTTDVGLYEIVSGGFANLATSGASTYSTSSEIYLEAKVSGANKIVKVFNGGAEIISFTDTSPRATGTPGLFHFDGTSGTASWRGGDFSGAAADAYLTMQPLRPASGRR